MYHIHSDQSQFSVYQSFYRLNNLRDLINAVSSGILLNAAAEEKHRTRKCVKRREMDDKNNHRLPLGHSVVPCIHEGDLFSGCSNCYIMIDAVEGQIFGSPIAVHCTQLGKN